MSSEEFEATESSTTGDHLSCELHQLLTLTDSLEIFCAIHAIYAFSHKNFSKWKELDLTFSVIEDLIAMVRRFEGTFQFKGLGIWLLEMLLISSKNSPGLQALGSISTINTLIRISLEYNAQDKCFRYFLKCIELRLTTFGQLCDIGKHTKHLITFRLLFFNFRVF